MFKINDSQHLKVLDIEAQQAYTGNATFITGCSSRVTFENNKFHRRKKRWRFHILPKYLANLTLPISHKESTIFIPSCTN